MTSQMSDEGGAIAASAQLTRQASIDFRGQVDGLNGRLGEIGAHWQGAAAAAFGRVTAAWNDQVTRLFASLDGFADSLEGVDRSFQATNDDAARSLDLIASRLG